MQEVQRELAPSNLGKVSFHKREWLQILLIFVVVRLVISFMGIFTLWNSTPVPPPWIDLYYSEHTGAAAQPSQAAKLLINGWNRWDTDHFVKIAMAGYASEDGSLSFMPLYPLLIQVTQRLTGLNALLSAILVSNLFCIAALILFFEVALLELGSAERAWQAFAFLITFPAAFFLFAAYSESLYLTLTLGMWLLIRRNRWPPAALASSLAVLTRLQGLALVFPLGWQALVSIQAAGPMPPLQEIRSVVRFYTQEQGWRRLFKPQGVYAWPAALFPVITLLLYNLGIGLAGLNSVFGAYTDRASPTAFPWQGFVEFLQRIFTIRYLPSDYVDLVLVILFCVVLAASVKKITPAMWFYSLAVLVMVFSRSYGANLLSGFMRFVLTTFPFFLALAALNLNRWQRNALLIFFLFAQLILLWSFLLWIWVA